MQPTLFTEKLHCKLEPDLATATMVCVAVALLTAGGAERLKQHTAAGARVELLVGLDLPTTPEALQLILEWSQRRPNIAVRVWDSDGTTFHPKVYLLEQVAGWVAYVGSANCTDGGWQHNEELTARVEGEAASKLRRVWFALRFAKGVPLTADFIAEYRAAFVARAAADQLARAAANEAKQRWREWLRQQRLAAEATAREAAKATTSNAQRPVRPGQFFREEHYAAFDGGKPRSRASSAVKERYAVYDQMQKLHRLLQPLVKAEGWDLHPHFVEKHIVSSAEHSPYAEEALRAIWLNYGRSKPAIKSYGEQFTPMPFIRLEVIIFDNRLETWCRIGKDGAFDRDFFENKLRDSPNRQAYFNLLRGLGDRFFIQVRGDNRPLNSFADADELYSFVQHDRQGHYFIIGKSYQPNDPGIADAVLPATVMHDWSLLYRVYQWMKRPER